MNRRGVLKGMGAAAAASLWPGWLSEAFAGAPCAGGRALKGVVTLSAALQRAHAALQPLLIFVISKDNGQNWLRGQHFGEYLNHGGNLDLAPLACAGVVCAEMDAVRQLFPSAPKDEEPAALVADVERAPARIGVAMRGFTHAEALFDLYAPPQDDAAMSAEQRQAYFRARRQQMMDQEDDQISACIRATGAAIRAAVLDDYAAAKRRADASWSRLTEGQREAARQIIAGGEGTVDEVLATAPVLSVAASERSGDPRLLQLLADAARARYCAQRVPGSKWANASGCGETIEGEESNITFGCGMGHVPRRSSRFLYFFTRPPYEPQE